MLVFFSSSSSFYTVYIIVNDIRSINNYYGQNNNNKLYLRSTLCERNASPYKVLGNDSIEGARCFT